MRVIAIALAFLTFLFTSSPDAQLGRSPIEDLIAEEFFTGLGEQIGEAIQAAAATSRSLAVANNDLQSARRRFWAAYDAGVRNGPAETEVGRKLLAQDLVLMSLNVVEGTQGTTVLGFTAIFGQLDGGIPSLARTPFEDWFKAIRSSLGALKPGAAVASTPGTTV